MRNFTLSFFQKRIALAIVIRKANNSPLHVKLWTLALGLLLYSEASAQSFPSSGKCTSKDLDLVETLFIGDSPNSLLPGNRKVQMTISNRTNSDRRSFALWGKMKRYDSDGALLASENVFYCVDSVRKNSTANLFAKDQVYFGEDQRIVITDIYTAWSSAGTNQNCDYLSLNTSKISPSCQWKDSLVVYTGVNSKMKVANAICENGKGNLSARPYGGKAPYKITVGDGQGNSLQTYTVEENDSMTAELAPGDYIISVTDAKNNTNTFNKKIEKPRFNKPSPSVKHPTCDIPRGQIIVTSTEEGFSYQLRQNAQVKYSNVSGYFSDLDAGLYEVIAVKGTCYSIDTMVVDSRPMVPAIPQMSIVQPDCNKIRGSVTVTNAETEVAYYLYKNGVRTLTAVNGIFSAVEPGDYRIIAAGSSCFSSDSLHIEKWPFALAVPQATVVNPDCFQGTGTVTVIDADAEAVYYLKQGSSISYTATAGVFASVVPGDYQLVATKNICTKTDSLVVAPQPYTPGKPEVSIIHPSCVKDKGLVTVENRDKKVNYHLYQNGSKKFTASDGIFNEVDPGPYEIVAAAEVCSNADSMLIKPKPYVPARPVAEVVQPDCNRASGLVSVSNPIEEVTYYLQQGNNITFLPGEGSLDGVSSGAYELVAYSNRSSCTNRDTVVVKDKPKVPAKPKFTVFHPDCFVEKGKVKLDEEETDVVYELSQNVNDISRPVNGIFSEVVSGQYIIVARGASCNNQDVLTVNPRPKVPAKPKFNVDQPNCFNSKGFVFVTELESEVNYKIFQNGLQKFNSSNGRFSEIDPGQYELVAEGAACKNADVLVIEEQPYVPSKPESSIKQPDCKKAKGWIVVTNASERAIYQLIQNGVIKKTSVGDVFEEVEEGIYELVAQSKSSACSRLDTIRIFESPAIPATPVITATGETIACKGSAVNLNSDVSAGLQWFKDGLAIEGATDPSYAAFSSGKYSVTSTSGNCTSDPSEPIDVMIKETPSQPFIATDDATLFCKGESAALVSSLSAGNQWLKDGLPIEGATSQTYLARETGKYSVKVLLSGCTSTISDPLSVTVKMMPAEPVVLASGSTTFCDGGNVKLSSDAVSGNQWYKDGIKIEGATGSDFIAAKSGRYTVTSTIDGCTSGTSAAAAVTVKMMPAEPVVLASGSTTFCDGGNVKLSSDAVSGNQWYKDGIKIEGATGSDFIAAKSGRYTVTSTIDGCTSGTSAAAAVTVKMMPAEPVVLASGSTTFCDGGNVKLSSDAVSGNQWYKDGIKIEGATGSEFIAAKSGRYTVTSTIDGCTSGTSAAAAVTVKMMPAEPVVLASGSTTFCDGGNVKLSSDAVSGNQWYKDGIKIEGATGSEFIAAKSGRYTVTSTIDGCTSGTSAAAAVTVKMMPAEPVVLASGSTTFCDGGNVKLSSDAVSGNQWYKDGIKIEGATGSDFIAAKSGRYTVTSTIEGCTGAASTETVILVKQNPSVPVISADGVTAFCEGGQVKLTSNAVTGNQWYRNGIALKDQTASSFLALASGVYSVSSTVNGCTTASIGAVPVTVNSFPSAPVIIANGNLTFCEGESVLFTTNSTSGIQWIKDGSIIKNATGTSYFATEPGYYTVSATTNGCTSTAQSGILVKVKQRPSAPAILANGATAVCEGGLVSLATTVNQGNQWYKNGMALNSASGMVYGAATSGIYTMSVSADGCISAKSNPVTVNILQRPSTPSLNALSATTFCAGNAVEIHASTAKGNQWYLNGVAIPGANGFSYQAAVSGNYSVVTNDGACSSYPSAVVKVTVIDAASKPVVTVSGATSLCSGGTLQLTSSADFGNQWYSNDKPLAGMNQKSLTVKASGTYYVISGVNDCKSAPSEMIVVKVNEMPSTPKIIAEGATTFCAGNEVTLTSNEQAGNQWYKDGVAIEKATASTFKANATGSYSVRSNANGCLSPVSQAIAVSVKEVPEAPKMAASGVTTFCEGGSVDLYSSAKQGNQWYLDGNPVEAANQVVFTAKRSGKYQVVAAKEGCVGEKSNEIQVVVNEIPEQPRTYLYGIRLWSSSAVGNQWYKNGVQIEGATEEVFTPGRMGSYQVKVTKNSCESPLSEPVRFIIGASAEIGIDEYIKIFPNPLGADGLVNLHWKLNDAPGGLTVHMRNIIGQDLGKLNVQSNVKQFRLPDVAGVYVIEVRWGKDNRRVFEVMKRKR